MSHFFPRKLDFGKRNKYLEPSDASSISSHSIAINRNRNTSNIPDPRPIASWEVLQLSPTISSFNTSNFSTELKDSKNSSQFDDDGDIFHDTNDIDFISFDDSLNGLNINENKNGNDSENEHENNTCSEKNVSAKAAIKSLNEKNEPHKDAWENYLNFRKKSLPSDAIIYAQTRREAWLQFVRCYQPGLSPGMMGLWSVASLIYLQKGHTIINPEFREEIKRNRGLASKGLECKNITILDLEGVLRSPLTWQKAMDYPDTVVYGYQLSSYDFGGGPPNFIPFQGQSLTKLPFKDNLFDSVASSSLWYLLNRLEWGQTINEVFRVLKPGGYIELLVSDFSIINPDPDDKKWVDLIYGNGLSKRGMDQYPSRKIDKHLKDAGFKNINKACVALPRASNLGGSASYVTDFMIQFYWLQLVNLYGQSFMGELEKIEEFKNYCLRLSSINVDCDHQSEANHRGTFRDSAPSQYITLIYAQKPLYL